MSDFPMDDRINEPSAQPSVPADAPVNEPAPVPEAAAEAAAPVTAEEAEISAAEVSAAEMSAAEMPAAEFAETAAEEAAAEPVEASWSSDAAPAAEPAAPVYTKRPRAACPARAARPVRTANPGRVWGICIGLSLGILFCGCVVLLTFFAVNAGRGIKAPVLPTKPEVQTQQPQEQEQERPDFSVQIHDVPRDEDGFTTQYIVEQVRDSVVGILVYKGSGLKPAGAGTGIVMSEDGYIITNAHVVVVADKLTVVMHDETRHTARVIGYDEKTDLAVIKIDATGLQPAEFGDSDNVIVGERVIAVGNPGGLAGSVSQGIVSGLDREVSILLTDNTRTTITAIQTDAAINPGNSGGPLFNAWGQVIGINSAKIAVSGYEGIGFAIPLNEAKPILDNLIQYGYVKDRPLLGITVIALDSSNGPANGLPSQGLYISSIEQYSDMRRIGIEIGDVILKVDGKEMRSTEDLTEVLKGFRPGDTVAMEILRTYDNSILKVDVLLLDAKAAEG